MDDQGVKAKADLGTERSSAMPGPEDPAEGAGKATAKPNPALRRGQGGAGDPRQPCLTLLSRDPMPLFSERTNLALLWSAKAACTFAVKWFFFQEGILEEVLEYSAWPHHYREQVYCRRPGYVRSLQRIPDLGPRAVKFVRNPFERAVSGYLSVCDQAIRLTHPPHGLILAGLTDYLGREVGNGESLTFREYVGYLDTIDLETCDVHLRQQFHISERAGCVPDLTILRVEEGKSAIPALEDDLGLDRSDLGALRESVHHTRRVEVDRFVGDDIFKRTLGPPIPVTGAFYDEELVREVRRLYAVDFDAYGYPGVF